VAVISVEPTNAACLMASLAAGEPNAVPTPGTAMAGLDCSEVSPAAWPTLRRGISGALAVSDQEADAARADLAGAGLTIGESGAAPLAGLRALVQDGACSALREHLAVSDRTRALLIATEGNTSGRAA
jgi:diaminopropionate ammonia-lyase